MIHSKEKNKITIHSKRNELSSCYFRYYNCYTRPPTTLNFALGLLADSMYETT